MDICLINPASADTYANPLFNFDKQNQHYLNPCNTQHLGLAYICAAIKEAGYNAEVYDMNFETEGYKGLCKQFVTSGCKVYGISCYYFNYFHAQRIAREIKRLCSDSFVFVGGMFPTLSYQEIDYSYIDCSVIGEGERTDLEILRAILHNKNWRTIKGIAYKEGEEIIFTGKPTLLLNLDELPMPDRKYIGQCAYVPILTTRGCRGQCNYCAINAFYTRCEGRSLRRRSVDSVIDEIKQIISLYKVSVFKLTDPNFPLRSQVDKIWFYNFYIKIVEEEIDVNFICEMRADEILNSEQELALFKKIGLTQLSIGVESLLQSHLNYYKKMTTVEQNIRAIQILEQLDISYSCGILLFNPYTTIEELLKFCALAETMFSNPTQKNIFRPISLGCNVVAIPGTELYEEMRMNNALANNENNYVFFSNQTARCFEYIQKWMQPLSQVYELNDLYLIAKSCKKELLPHIYTAFRRLFYLDLRCIRLLATNSNHHDIGSLERILSDEIIKLNVLKQEILSIRDKLD